MTITNPTNTPVEIKVDGGIHGSKELLRGTYTFPNISPGMHEVEIIYKGKVVHKQNVNVVPNMTAHIFYNVSLPPPPPPPPTHEAKGTIIVDVVAVAPQPHPVPPIHPVPPGYGRPPVTGAPRLLVTALSLQVPRITVEVDNITKTGPIGRFEFSNLRPGAHTVKVYANGRQIYSGTVYITAGQTKTIHVTYTPLPKTGTLIVDVTMQSSGTGAPSSGIGKPPIGGPHRPGGVGTPHLTYVSYTPWYSTPYVGGISSLSGNVVVSVDGIRKSGGFGRYNFSNLNPGTHRVEVFYNGRLVKSVMVSVSPGQTKTVAVPVVVTPTLPPIPPTPPSHGTPPAMHNIGAIAVTITNPTPIPAYVMIDGGRYGNKRVWKGTVTFNNIPAGTHNVEIRYEGHIVYSKSVNVVPNMTAHVYYTVHQAPSPMPPHGVPPHGGPPTPPTHMPVIRTF